MPSKVWWVAVVMLLKVLAIRWNYISSGRKITNVFKFTHSQKFSSLSLITYYTIPVITYYCVWKKTQVNKQRWHLHDSTDYNPSIIYEGTILGQKMYRSSDNVELFLREKGLCNTDTHSARERGFQSQALEEPANKQGSTHQAGLDEDSSPHPRTGSRTCIVFLCICICIGTCVWVDVCACMQKFQVPSEWSDLPTQSYRVDSLSL